MCFIIGSSTAKPCSPKHPQSRLVNEIVTLLKQSTMHFDEYASTLKATTVLSVLLSSEQAFYIRINQSRSLWKEEVHSIYKVNFP